MTIGEKLRALRFKKRLSQEELVELLNKKFKQHFTRETYAKWETDGNPLSIEILKVFVMYYKITADDLIFEDRRIGNLKSVNHIRRVDLVDYKSH